MDNVEKSVETVWKSVLKSCSKVSTLFWVANKNVYFLCKSFIFHKVVQKIYPLFSTLVRKEKTDIGKEFYTFSTYPTITTTNLFNIRKVFNNIERRI